MRVLVLTAAYPSPEEPTRAVAVENLTRALGVLPGASSIAVGVVAPRVYQADPAVEMRGGVRVCRYRYPSGGRRLKEAGRPSVARISLYLLSGTRATIRECRRFNADLLLCHWVIPTGPIGAVASNLLRIPLVLVAHGSDVLRYASSSWAAGLMARRALRAADRVLAVSRDLEEKLRERYQVPPERLGVLPMGVDESIFRPPSSAGRLSPAEARKRLNLEGRSPLLLYVGDFLEEKGVRDLVAAHEQLTRGGVATTLALVGDGPLREELEQKATGPSPRIRVVGPVSQRRLVEWYQAADLLVLPSHSEGTPVAVLEALTVGLPVVASRVGGLPDVVEDGKTGRLVPPRDPQALRAAIREALVPGTGEQMRDHLAAGCHDFSVGRRAAELAAILEKVLAAHAGKVPLSPDSPQATCGEGRQCRGREGGGHE